jgi:hypothetical protein
MQMFRINKTEPGINELRSILQIKDFLYFASLRYDTTLFHWNFFTAASSYYSKKK